MIALDDAAWAAPWRHVRVGEKLLLSLGLVLTALIAPPWPAAPLVAAAAIGLSLGPARIPVRTLAIGFAAPFTFIVIGAISVAIQVAPLAITQTSIANGLSVFARSVAGTLAILLLATTTPMVDLLGWLRRRGVPGPLIEIASLMYRLLFVLMDTAIAIRGAQAARLGDARPWQSASTAMGALLVRSWDRAARLTDGLAARGIDGDLVLLPSELRASPRFLAGTLALLTAIWLAVVAWRVFG